jgi:pyroglutamyl-peptidase
MSLTILLTGFSPFPTAPFNPTEPLVHALARRRHPAFANVRRVSHVFKVSYETVDRELPALLASEKPDAIVMFGLAGRTTYLRIETRARNGLTRALPDVDGRVPTTGSIVAGAAAALSLRSPAQRLLIAARSTGLPAALSRDAGRYLCNYLCWRAAEAAHSGTPRLVSFIHVPQIDRALSAQRSRPTLDDLIEAGEAIVRAAVIATRTSGLLVD